MNQYLGRKRLQEFLCLRTKMIILLLQTNCSIHMTEVNIKNGLTLKAWEIIHIVPLQLGGGGGEGVE